MFKNTILTINGSDQSLRVILISHTEVPRVRIASCAAAAFLYSRLKALWP